MSPSVCIYVVTYRRPDLLMRALRSLVAQTHDGWRAVVLNDDPQDERVTDVVERIGDARIELLRPARKRGGTGNFNYAFRSAEQPFAAILEDDNWWEPEFLSVMLEAMSRHPEVSLACGNERIWSVDREGNWTDTGRTIWDVNGGERLFAWSAEEKCGSARLCNSSMLFRTERAERMRTPATIPIDVTEHFRERVVPHPFLLVHAPLVNYADTENTHRSTDMGVWATYQLLLIGSVFAGVDSEEREALAQALWNRARSREHLLATSLLGTGLFVAEARALWRLGRASEKLRFGIHAIRHPFVLNSLRTARRRRRSEWQWLLGERDA